MAQCCERGAPTFRCTVALWPSVVRGAAPTIRCTVALSPCCQRCITYHQVHSSVVAQYYEKGSTYLQGHCCILTQYCERSSTYLQVHSSIFTQYCERGSTCSRLLHPEHGACSAAVEGTAQTDIRRLLTCMKDTHTHTHIMSCMFVPFMPHQQTFNINLSRYESAVKNIYNLSYNSYTSMGTDANGKKTFFLIRKLFLKKHRPKKTVFIFIFHNLKKGKDIFNTLECLFCYSYFILHNTGCKTLHELYL